jgi:hypothetical protein
MSEWLRRSPDASHYHARIVEVMKGGSRRLPAAIAKMPARKEGA